MYHRLLSRGFTPPLLSALMLLVLAVVLGGCAKKVTQTEQYARAPEEAQPIVLSSTPRADRMAWADSEEEINSVDWAKMQQMGPRPVWDRLGRRDRRFEVEGDNPSPQAHERTSDVDSPDSPLALNVSPATQPATQPTIPMHQIDEADLPVTVVELPDGRLRIIWNLHSYGGTNVSSTRDGGTTRRNVNVTPPDLAPLVNVLNQHVGPNGNVTPLPRENTLVITCEADMRTSLIDLLARLDVAPRQVEITAKIFEVSHDFDFQQGARVLLNRVAANDAQQAISIFDRVQQQGQAQGSVISLMRVFQDAGIDLETSFQLLADVGMIRVVSSPRMTVAAGQTGYLLAGQELPIQSTTIVGNNVNVATSYKPVGVQLYITPQAVGASRIKLHAISVVSSVSGFAPMPTLTGGNSARPVLINPIIDSREAETAVTVEDGHTLVISGLRMIRTTTRENKVPGLGDLPLIGWLFKNHRSQQQMTDLYFFLTPTLL
jgi:hypothetical protein